MKLLFDMNLSPLLATELSSAGFEAVHWSKVGAFNATDPELMVYAAHHGYVVVTHDLDFGAILAASFHFYIIREREGEATTVQTYG